MKLHRLALSLFLILSAGACESGSDDTLGGGGEPEATADTAAPEGEPEADTAAGEAEPEGEPESGPPPAGAIDATLTFMEVLEKKAVKGADVTAGNQIGTTDDDGTVTLAVVGGENVELTFSADGYRDHNLYTDVPDEAISLELPVANDLTIATIGLGLFIDDSMSIVAVNLYQGTLDAPDVVPGATIDIDKAYDTALRIEGGAPAESNETIEGAPSLIAFLNVASGTVNVTITPPAGMTCEGGNLALTTSDGGFTVTNVHCQ